MTPNYLVCYDIRDEGRLMKVYNKMKKTGLHIQYSVFHCRLSRDELLELKESLNSLIEISEDDIRIYPLPSDIKVTVMGQGDRVPDGVTILI
ncbi:MAG: CRISPR-associated endonuclease Cas2 [Syntrophorhabdaceae bacterium]|nr:CRISPR-associated endonuclease Cas2 [Syntrophorhabdaceae bacterium]